MNKETLKSSLKLTSNLILFLSLALMVLTVWLENFYLGVATIAISAMGVVASVLSEKGVKIFTQDLNLYFFVVAIIIAIASIYSVKVLFYIGLVLFLLMILLYLIPLFVTEKEDKPAKGKNKK